MKPFQVNRVAANLATALALLVTGAFPAAAQFPGFGGGGGRSSATPSGGLQAATRVSVVADEYSNSLIILAPEPYHEAISNLVQQLDVPVQDITELRAFQLRNADPTEMAKVLSSLFPDPTTSTTTSGRGFGTFFGGGTGGRGGTAASTEGERAKKQSKVLAVADPRTSSVLVSASKDLMEQIAPMIAELDASSSKKQQVYVHTLENADPQEVELILRNLFETQNARSGRTAAQNNQQNNALTQRSSNAARNQGTTTGTSSGLGTTSGLGGQGGTGR